jgi:hypothetical protein
MSNVFICWSGHRSERLGGALRTYLPKFIPGLLQNPDDSLFMSADIAKGSRWFDEVEKELDSATAGLVCLTREALQSGWIHFEAGALARAVRKNDKRSGRRGGALYTYLLGVQPDELRGPLSEFQSTRFDREDTKRFCAAMVTSMHDNAPTRDAWESSFDANWQGFADAVKEIGPMPAAGLIPELEEMFRNRTFEEAIEECTRQTWIDRFTGARETIARLKTRQALVKADNSYVLDLYNDLLAELDGYSMNMGALLLKEKKFEVNPEEGTLVIGNGIRRACEQRRGRIRKLVAHLLSPNCAPVLEEQSRRYAKITSFEAKKTMLLHPAERAIQQEHDGKGKPTLTSGELSSCASSLWEFDRIYFYMMQENSSAPQVDQLSDSLDHEFENIRAVDGGTSLIPLHYVIRALKKSLAQPGVAAEFAECNPRIRHTLNNICKVLDDLGLDKGRQVKENIEALVEMVSGTVTPPAVPKDALTGPIDASPLLHSADKIVRPPDAESFAGG